MVEWNPRRAKHELGPHVESLPAYIAAARAALQPVKSSWLADRLSTMQLAMTTGWSEAKATAWLHEMRRLLEDLPQDIVGQAIDDAIKSTKGGYMPSVGEIRAIADPRVADRTRILHRLEGIASLTDAPRREDDRPTPPSEAERAAIRAEYGVPNFDIPSAPRAYSGPARNPTTDEQRDIAVAIGIDPTARAAQPAADITGLSIAEIFAQREARRAGVAIDDAPVAAPKSFAEAMDEVDRYLS